MSQDTIHRMYCRGCDYCDPVSAEANIPVGTTPSPDPVNHPPHYNAHPAGVECIDIAEHYGFNVGNTIKYLWRSGLKGDAIEDLEKAAWYLAREIEKRKQAKGERGEKGAMGAEA